MWDPRRRKRRSRRARASRERRREVANATNVDRERPIEAQSFVLIQVHAHLRAHMRRVDRIRDEPVLRARRSRSVSHPALARLARPRLSCRPRALDVPSRALNVDITTRSITSPRPRVLRRRHCRARARPRRWCPFCPHSPTPSRAP